MTPATSAADSNEPTTHIVAEFARRTEAGEAVDLDAFCRLYPEPLRDAIRERCRMYLAAKDMFRSRPATKGPLTGRQLGDFRIKETIGHGGMGEVYVATQLSLSRDVALKRLRTAIISSPHAVERFEREAATAAKLRHPGIVPVYAVGHTDGEHYLVMEYVRGHSLNDHLDVARTRETLDARQLGGSAAYGYFRRAAEVVAQIAAALDYAHAQGVIHRDVKPHNILIDEFDGKPRLADFGLAFEVGAQPITDEGDLAGSSFYMSPEQTLARRVTLDHRTDIFSLGVVLYEILTLRRPFTGESRSDVLFAISFVDPTSPRQLVRDVPRDLETICLKCLEKNRDSRYQTAAALAADLQRFLEHRAIEARPPSWLERGMRFVTRHRAALLVAVTIALAIVAGVLLARGWSRRASLLAEASWGSALLETIERASYEQLHNARVRATTARSSLRGDQDLDRILQAILTRIEAMGQARKIAALDLLKRTLAASIPSQSDYFTSVGMLHEAGMLLPDDADVHYWLDVHHHLPTLSVTTDEPGAMVSVRAIDPFTAKPGAKRLLGRTPLDCMPIEPGHWRIIVEQPGVGFAELTRMIDRLGHPHPPIHAVIVPTQTATSGMIRIAEGSFIAGSNDMGESAYRERPETVAGFLIDECEVANREYKEFVDRTHHQKPRSWDGGYRDEWNELPVVGVAYDDAQAYAEWRGRRLPTWLEWERAGRGEDGAKYPWGNEPDSALANLGKQLSNPHEWWPHLMPVSSLDEGRSVLGLYHMLGNAAEWTESVPLTAITSGIVPMPATRIVKGGAVIGYRPDTTLGHYSHDETCDWDHVPMWIGFRCAKSVEP